MSIKIYFKPSVLNRSQTAGQLSLKQKQNKYHKPYIAQKITQKISNSEPDGSPCHLPTVPVLGCVWHDCRKENFRFWMEKNGEHLWMLKFRCSYQKTPIKISLRARLFISTKNNKILRTVNFKIEREVENDSFGKFWDRRNARSSQNK